MGSSFLLIVCIYVISAALRERLILFYMKILQNFSGNPCNLDPVLVGVGSIIVLLGIFWALGYSTILICFERLSNEKLKKVLTFGWVWVYIGT